MGIFINRIRAFFKKKINIAERLRSIFKGDIEREEIRKDLIYG